MVGVKAVRTTPSLDLEGNRRDKSFSLLTSDGAQKSVFSRRAFRVKMRVAHSHAVIHLCYPLLNPISR
jgi:hypothetical protein